MNDAARSTVNIRMSGYAAVAISSSELSIGSFGGHPESGISMFDWPDASHTSPKTTSSMSIAADPFSMRSEPLLPACGVLSVSIQVPSRSAVVSTWSPQPGIARTTDPGAARPMTGTSASCCSTIPFVNRA